ncbi:MAG: hypothetical protein EOO75_18505 [Myxococcales bacterium]|nr:MAG: hypothetical protein EOO75_18505 [Myxococcales bacterium]
MASSVFALELAFPYDPSQNGPRQPLRELILKHPGTSSLRDRSLFYRAIADLLLAELPAAGRGCWDYYDDDLAVDKYDEWCGGLLKEEGARQLPSLSGQPSAYRGANEVRYATFTVAFLMVRGSTVDRLFHDRCQVIEANLWRRATFAHLLHALRAMTFASVRSDVVYMIPNDDTFGLTADDLRAEKFAYLREIR